MPRAVNQIAQPHVDADIARSWTLPSHLYTHSAALAEERQRIFSRTWQLVARRDQLANPGDYVTTEVAGEPLLLVRDGEGKLRGFYNVCRHRAGPPAEGCGSRKVFRCSYHGWTYALDGHLLNAPEFEGVEDFRPQEFGLVPVRAEEWALWVFVNLDEAAEPLLSALRELPAQAAPFGIERLRFVERREYVMQCNWKTYLDNYLEGYHLPSVHPGLNRELDYSQYITETYARHSRQSSPIRGAQKEGDHQKGAARRYAQATGGESCRLLLDFSQLDAELLSRQPLHELGCAARAGEDGGHLRVVRGPGAAGNGRGAGRHPLQRFHPARRRRHLRKGAAQPALAQLPARPLQREAGEGRPPLSSVVRGVDVARPPSAGRLTSVASMPRSDTSPSAARPCLPA